MSSDRARLARELHDGIAQDLVAVGYSLDLILANPETSTQTRSQIRTLRFNISDLIDKVRREIYFLGQPISLSLDERIRTSANRECGSMELIFNLDVMSVDVSPNLTYEIDRIAQEILRNVANHSKADKVAISLKETKDVIELSIRDNGVGGAEIKKGHFGIQAIRDRASVISAELDIQSNAQGTRVLLRVPSESRANA